MGTTLTGKLIADTYDALLKVTDNNVITGIRKRLTDGFGNDTPLLISSTDVQIDGNFILPGTTSQYVRGDGSIASFPSFVTSVSGTGTVSGLTLTGTVTSSGSLTLGGSLTLTSGDVTGALGFTPYNATNPSNYIALTALSSSSPLSYNNLTGAFSIQQASGSQNGFLSSTDWTTFNNKQNALTNPVTGTGTTNTLPKFTGASTIGNSNITDTGSLITLGSNSYVNGNLGIGSTGLTQYNLRLERSITGNATSFSFYNAGIVQSDVTTTANYNATYTNTAAASFTLAGMNHYNAIQGIFGAGSTVTTQSGFRADSSLIGATNNYGFRGLIPSGTNRWNLYMDGTANNYLAGSLGIGTTALTGVNLNVNKAITGGTTAYGMILSGAVQSDVTANARLFYTNPSTQAAAFTVNQLVHYYANQGTFGAGSTVNVQTGFLVESTLIGATNNYGFRGIIPAGTGRWNLYMDGTANNYLAGSLGIGTTSPGRKLSISSTTNQPELQIIGSGSGVRAQLETTNDHGTWLWGVAGDTTGDGLIYTAGSRNLRLFTADAERMRITSSGNVGIGTSSPSLPLHLYNSAAALAYFETTNANGAYTIWRNSGTSFGDVGSALGISGSGSASDFMVASRSGNMIIGTGSAERMRITSGGEVGIGTSSPSRKLSVSGQTYLGGDTFVASNGGIFFSGDGSYNAGVYGRNSGLDLVLQANNSERMRITSSGNVGIGTSSPNEKLSVIGAISANNGMIVQGYSAAASGLNCEMGVVSGYVQYNAYNRSTSAYGQFRLDGSSLILNAGSNGNVGIGTTSPASKLDVWDYTSFLNLSSNINSEATTNNQQIGGINFRKHYGLAIGAAIRQLQAGGTTAYAQAHLAFYTQDGSIAWDTPVERMRITSGGNVGIGTNSPARLLHASASYTAPTGGIDSNIQILTSNTSGASGIGMLASNASVSFLHFGDTDSANIGQIAYTHANDNMLFVANGSERMRITSGGNVGIGTSSPDSYPYGGRLNVNGNISVNGTKIGWGVTDAFTLNSIDTAHYGLSSNFNLVQLSGYGGVVIATLGAERMRIASDGAIQMRNVFNRRTASYTLVLGDAGKIVETNLSSANTVTVPFNTTADFPIGTEIMIMQYGSGQTTISPASGVSIRSKNSNTKIADQYTGATLVKVAQDEWYLVGNLTA